MGNSIITIRFINLIIAVVISLFFGRNRKIGVWWSLLFTITLSCVFGGIIVFQSPKKNNSLNTRPSKLKKIFAIILAVFSLFLLIRLTQALFYLNTKDNIQIVETINIGMFIIGLIGVYIYMIYPPLVRSKSKR